MEEKLILMIVFAMLGAFIILRWIYRPYVCKIDGKKEKIKRVKALKNGIGYIWNNHIIFICEKGCELLEDIHVDKGILIVNKDVNIIQFKNISNIKANIKKGYPVCDLLKISKAIVDDNNYDLLILQDGDTFTLYGEKKILDAFGIKFPFQGNLIMVSSNKNYLRVFNIPFERKSISYIRNFIKYNLNKTESIIYFEYNNGDSLIFLNKDSAENFFKEEGIKINIEEKNLIVFSLNRKSFNVQIVYVEDFKRENFNRKDINQINKKILDYFLTTKEPFLETININKFTIILASLKGGLEIIKEMISQEVIEEGLEYGKNGYNLMIIEKQNSDRKNFIVKCDFWPPEIIIDAADYILKNYNDEENNIVITEEWKSSNDYLMPH